MTAPVLSKQIIKTLEYFDVPLTLLNKVVENIKGLVPVRSNDFVLNIRLIKDFTLLPFCFIVIALFTNYKTKLLVYTYYALQLINAATLIYLAHHWPSQLAKNYVIPSILFVCASMLLVFQDNTSLNTFFARIMKKGASLGGISYGIYIIHFPILSIFHKITFFSGSWFSYYARFFIFISITLCAAYVLEKVFQPYAVRKLRAMGSSPSR